MLTLEAPPESPADMVATGVLQATYTLSGLIRTATSGERVELGAAAGRGFVRWFTGDADETLDGHILGEVNNGRPRLFLASPELSNEARAELAVEGDNSGGTVYPRIAHRSNLGSLVSLFEGAGLIVANGMTKSANLAAGTGTDVSFSYASAWPGAVTGSTIRVHGAVNEGDVDRVTWRAYNLSHSGGTLAIFHEGTTDGVCDVTFWPMGI